MSTLFDIFYDSLGHEMEIGMPVMAYTCGGRIYGHIVDMYKDKNDNEKYVIIPDIAHSLNITNLKKKYKINWKNVFQITIKKKK